MTALALLVSPAAACGGFFCDAAAPVDQASERVVFAVGGGEVTMHVQIAYVGDAADFAWILPVPAAPELFVSNDALFTILANRTLPTYTLTAVDGAACPERNFFFVDSSPEPAPTNGVGVVAEVSVGPYDAVTLRADSPDALVDWLGAHDYTVPDGLDRVLEPYVAASQVFVALRLRPGKTSGDLTPLALRYPGDQASLPIQLTSIAAVPDLPLQVYVLGPARSVPDNYLHVALNEAAIDWYGGGTNGRDVLARAVDEAGGHAFSTDFSGPTDPLRGAIWQPRLDLARMRKLTSPRFWAREVLAVVPGSSQLSSLILRFVPPPAGVDDADFLACPLCFDVVVPNWDPVAATDALDAEILDPLTAAEALVAGAAHLTRMSTTLDPSEMTLDPVFVFNTDLPQDVTNLHGATSTTHCGLGDGRRTLALDDGREIALPSARALANRDQTEADYLAPLASPAAIRIEDLGATGLGEILFDQRAAAAKDAAAFGRGCDLGGRGTVPWAALLLLGLRRRVSTSPEGT